MVLVSNNFEGINPPRKEPRLENWVERVGAYFLVVGLIAMVWPTAYNRSRQNSSPSTNSPAISQPTNSPAAYQPADTNRPSFSETYKPVIGAPGDALMVEAGKAVLNLMTNKNLEGRTE